jgi:hypothetical protein
MTTGLSLNRAGVALRGRLPEPLWAPQRAFFLAREGRPRPTNPAPFIRSAE